MSRIGIIVGMTAEAERVAAAGHPAADRPLVFVAAADARRAREGARLLLDQGIQGLFSFGLAGGLEPALGTGAVVLADAAVSPEGVRLETDAAWLRRLASLLAHYPRVTLGGIAGAERAVATTAEKAALRQLTGAVAVDMESLAAARAARDAGVPFMALRVILDPAGATLPSSALAGLGPDGRARALPVLARLLSRPWEVPSLLALGRDNRRALAVLGRLAADLGPAFGFRV